MSKKFRVLHVIDNFGVGGAELWLVATVKYLRTHPNLNIHFDFLASGGCKGKFDDEIKALGCQIFYLKYSFRRFFKFGKEFRKILKQNNYDVIHHHQDFVAGWHYLLGLPALPKLKVTHLHNPYNFVSAYISSPTRLLSYWLGRCLMVLFTDRITGTSDYVMDEYGYRKWPYKLKRVRPVYCGFDVEKFTYQPLAKRSVCEIYGWDPGTCKIALFVGRIDSNKTKRSVNQKNPEFAFSLAKRVIGQDLNWKFLFAGYKGELGTHMEEESKRLDFQNNIVFLGVRSDVAFLMSSANVLIFPSFCEGLGMVAVEAQAAGLSVAMSDRVPTESIVCEELVTVETLSLKKWEKALDTISRKIIDRSLYVNNIKNSPFSIDNSVLNLLQLYGI